MAKIWPFIHLDAFVKEEERLLLRIFSGFLKKDDFIGFTRRCEDFDGHSMVSKMVIEFFSIGLTTIELQQFVHAYVLKATILTLAGLRVKRIMFFCYSYSSNGKLKVN